MDNIIQETLSTVRPGQRFGFPLFGTVGTLEQPLQPRVIGAGTPSPERRSQVLPPQPVVIGNHRFRVDFAVEFFAAVFNGYSMSYLVIANVNRNGTGEVGLSGDETEGGFGFGLNITFDVDMQVESHPVFQSERNRTWNEILNQRVRPNIDLVPLILALPFVNSVLPIPPQVLQVFSTSRGGRGTVYGLFDRVTNRHLPDGQVRLSPRFTFNVNLASFVPGLDKLLKVLKFIGTSFEIGPNFSIAFPVTIRLLKLTTPAGSYDVVGLQNNIGRYALSNGPTLSSVPASITNISTVHSSNVSVSLRPGVYIYIALLKITVWSVSRDIDLFPGLTDSAFIRNFITLSTATTVAQAPAPAGLPEVVWG
jgi:hypothetical protein